MNKEYELVIDTSSEEMKVILSDGEDYSQNKNCGTKHLEHLLPEIDRLLNEKGANIKDISLFGLVLGPGSFTGVRIGVSTVKAFCFANSKAKLIGINLLEFLSDIVCKSNSNIKNDFFVVIKSTSNKFYVGRFSCKGESISQELLLTSQIEEMLCNEKLNIYSINTEYSFGNIKTKKIVVLPGNYLSFVKKLKEEKRFLNLEELRPIYLALSQAEEELLKKEGKLKTSD